MTITIIGMLAAMMMGALQMARNAGRDAATKATIAKLNGIIMARYEGYMTRRVPIQVLPNVPLATAAQMRLDAIRDLMRMEMPDHYSDIGNAPRTFIYRFTYNQRSIVVSSAIPEPAIHNLYARKYAAKRPAPGLNEFPKCLFLVVSMGNPEAMEQFNQSEIGVDPDGWQYFIDGHGAPIAWLRWAPGFSNQVTSPALPGYPLGIRGPSDIQSGDPINDHDPFDARNIQNGLPPPAVNMYGGFPAAFRLVPLIYSTFGLTDASCIFSGGDAKTKYQYSGNPYSRYPDSASGQNLFVGTPTSGSIAGIITNHHIEQR